MANKLYLGMVQGGGLGNHQKVPWKLLQKERKSWIAKESKEICIKLMEENSFKNLGKPKEKSHRNKYRLTLPQPTPPKNKMVRHLNYHWESSHKHLPMLQEYSAKITHPQNAPWNIKRNISSEFLQGEQTMMSLNYFCKTRRPNVK